MSDIKSLMTLFEKDKKWFFTLTLFFCSILVPGILFIFLFMYELFIEISTVKLILLAMSITIPIYLLNGVFYASFLLKKEEENNKLQMYKLEKDMNELNELRRMIRNVELEENKIMNKVNETNDKNQIEEKECIDETINRISRRISQLEIKRDKAEKELEGQLDRTIHDFLYKTNINTAFILNIPLVFKFINRFIFENDYSNLKLDIPFFFTIINSHFIFKSEIVKWGIFFAALAVRIHFS